MTVVSELSGWSVHYCTGGRGYKNLVEVYKPINYYVAELLHSSVPGVPYLKIERKIKSTATWATYRY